MTDSSAASPWRCLTGHRVRQDTSVCGRFGLPDSPPPGVTLRGSSRHSWTDVHIRLPGPFIPRTFAPARQRGLMKTFSFKIDPLTGEEYYEVYVRGQHMLNQ